MTALFGSGVSAIYQFQSSFSAFPGSGTWYPLSAYQRSDGETSPREVDPLLGRQSHNKRDPEASAPGLSQGGGPIEVPVCLREIGFWLTACFGSPDTTEASGVYTHVWESGADVLQYLAQSKKLADSWYERARGLAVNTLAFNLTKEAGYPRAQLGTLLRDTVKATSEASGTVAAAFDLLRVPAATPFVRRNGSAAPTTAFAFNYSNQLERFDPLNGTAYPDGFDPGDAQISGSFTVRLEDATYDDIADAETKEPWEFGWLKANGIAPGDDASLTFAINNLAIDRAPKSVTGRGRLFHTYNWVAEQDADDPAVTVTLVNDVSGYPPPPPPPPPPPGP